MVDSCMVYCGGRDNAFSSDKYLHEVLIIAKELMLIMEENCVVLFIEQSGFIIKLLTVNYFSTYSSYC